MKRNILTAIFVIGIFTFLGAVSAHAQTNLLGKYVIEIRQNLDESQITKIGFELKSGNIAVYSKVNESLELNKEKTGSWTWDKAKKQVTVTIPAFKDGEIDEPKVTVTFKLDGENLKVVKVSPVSAGKVGDVFKKL